MFRSSKTFFSCKIILASSVPSRREGLDVIHLFAVIIGLPVSLVRLSMRRVCRIHVLWVVVSCRAVVVCLLGLSPTVGSCHGL